MVPKRKQREEVVRLRKKGFSYSEIKKLVSVSKSSLSLWLREIKLLPSQLKRLRSKGNVARRLGSYTLRNIRIKRTEEIISNSISEIGELTDRELWLVGTALYWAEGTKQKVHDPSKRVIFSNSDPLMIRLYLKWLKKILNIDTDDILFEIYIHETHQKTVEKLSEYWSKRTGFPVGKFGKVYFKKNKVHSIRKNRGLEYSGVLRISVRRSTDLNRKIAGWTKGICKEFIN